MQSSSDRLRKYHNYNNYLYSHHSNEFIINCDISLCTEIIKTSYYNPLARKVILKYGKINFYYVLIAKSQLLKKPFNELEIELEKIIK